MRAGEIACLLGDNGAGKSTLIKTLSGVHVPDKGTLAVDGEPVEFNSPRDALDAGVATVYQDLAIMPLMSVTRNFFLGNEPTVGVGPLKRFDMGKAAGIAREEMKRIGIDIRDTDQAVGTLSGGERQTLAIARAEYFGARVLILDEPTSALGVKQSAFVLRHIIAARNRGLGVIFITHNVQHALPIGDTFTILSRGRIGGSFRAGRDRRRPAAQRDGRRRRAPRAVPRAGGPGAGRSPSTRGARRAGGALSGGRAHPST